MSGRLPAKSTRRSTIFFIDRAPTRRGRPTVAASLGDEPAIVIGDFYFAKAYEHAARTGVPDVVDILARTGVRLLPNTACATPPCTLPSLYLSGNPALQSDLSQISRTASVGGMSWTGGCGPRSLRRR